MEGSMHGTPRPEFSRAQRRVTEMSDGSGVIKGIGPLQRDDSVFLD